MLLLAPAIRAQRDGDGRAGHGGPGPGIDLPRRHRPSQGTRRADVAPERSHRVGVRDGNAARVTPAQRLPDRTPRRRPAVWIGNASDGRSRGVPFPPIVLDRAANQPLYRQIEVALRRVDPGRPDRSGHGPARASGPTRSTSASRAVTVMTAYEQLTAEGYLEPRPGRGTRRRAGPAGPCRPRRSPARRPAPAAPARCPPSGRSRARGGRSSADHAREPRFDFRTGLDAPRPVPVALLGAAAARARGGTSSRTRRPRRTYRYPEGDPRLRAELAAYLGHVPGGARRPPSRSS